MANGKKEKIKEKKEKRKTIRLRAVSKQCASFLLSSFFFLLSSFVFLHAQNPYESRNIVVKTPEGLVIRQIISFPALDNILRYEIEIEHLRQGRWVLVHEMETDINTFEVTLAAGDYRYRYTAYNRMNLSEGRSNWQNFQLIPAIAPLPESYQPFYGMYYELSDPNKTLTVYGSDFSARSEFALVKNRKNYDWSGITLQGRKDVIIPESAEISETEARLNFSRDSLKSGNYQIFVRNPGGLWECFAHVRVGYHNFSDFLFESGYSPTIDEDGFYGHGGNIGLGWFPVKTRIGNFGLGVQLFFGHEKESSGISGGTINLLYQYAAGERLQHNVRLGIFPSGYWVNDEWDIKPGYWDPKGSIDPNTGEWIYENWIEEEKTLVKPGYDEFFLYINFGYSVQYFFRKNLYAAAGIDFLFALGDSGNKSKFQIKPGIGIGFQTGRWGERAEVVEGARKGEDYSVPVTNRPKGEHLLSVGWSPMIPLSRNDLYKTNRILHYGNNGIYTHSSYEQVSRYLNEFNPLGFNLRYAYFPHRWDNNKLGLGLDIAALEHEERDRNDIFDFVSRFLLHIHYQRVLSEKLQFGGRMGIGISYFPNYVLDYTEEGYFNGNSSECIPFTANFGVSLQYFFLKNAFIEAGLDIDFMGLWSDKVKFALRPGVSFGWQFGRGFETGLRLPGARLARFKKNKPLE